MENPEKENNKPTSAQGSGLAKSKIALREEEILHFWKENKVFEKSLEKNSPKGNYVFYDGPPFATGLPHYGHILGSTAKDVIGRYQTMQGYHVPRKWGWDCHGLPIENIVEKDLGVSGHNEIEAMGIDKFTEYARSKVLTFAHEWKRTVDRIGRWVDFDNGYKTMDNTFIESVWWALKELHKKDLIYEGVRVLAYCSRCETPIAKSEIAMDNSYKDLADISVYVKFPLVDPEQNSGSINEPVLSGARVPTVSLLAWTTTPWSLPGDIVVAVNAEAIYVKAKIENEFYILAKDRVEVVMKDKQYEIVEEFRGLDLVGKKYTPPFDYYTKTEGIADNPKAWTVVPADFVTTTDGTGIAHEAPAFGEDDMNLAKKENLPWIVHVDETGRFKPEVTDFVGMLVKPKSAEKDGHQKADIEIIKYLAKKGVLFAKEKIMHPYPHCMRCDTPIIYYALPSWFINIQKYKKEIIEKAETMNWVPEHLKEGRFKHTMEGAPDWNISRNRYWASPLPIWKCAKCEKMEFIGSLAELKEKTKKSGNTYFVMRHGESESNVRKISSSDPKDQIHLTQKGIEQIRESVKLFKDIDFDYIFVSPFLRTLETLDVIKSEIKLLCPTIVDDRIMEYNAGEFSGRPLEELNKLFKNKIDEFTVKPKDGECVNDVKKRVAEFLYESESKYQNKKILIISHGDPVWMMYAISKNITNEDLLKLGKEIYPKNAEILKIDFTPIPHNADFELDFHRPYIDRIQLKCECGEEMQRIPEVVDCWFEAGSMPFAQDHFPFERPNWQKENFPGGFVAEYIAQTRTWYYYTHVISTILFGHAPFENIVTTGTVLAEDGSKMSKSKNNFPDPWILFDKYGVDAIRFYLMSSALMKGEDVNFLEKTVQEVASKIIGRFDNVIAFYELYRDKEVEDKEHDISKNALDRWIIARLQQLVIEVTNSMEAYNLAQATRPMDLFLEDLSTWYLRRCRERLKDGDIDAKQTLYFVLKVTAQIFAPFMPFLAEDAWQKLKFNSDPESVHLTNFFMDVGGEKGDTEVIEEMQLARQIVSLGLKERQKVNIPVRQPLQKLKIKSIKLKEEYTEIIKDELNIKEITEDQNIENEVELDTNITPELKKEGDFREFVRAIQDLRKKEGLMPSDSIVLTISKNAKEIVEPYLESLKKTVLYSELKFADGTQEVKIDDIVYTIGLTK